MHDLKVMVRVGARARGVEVAKIAIALVLLTTACATKTAASPRVTARSTVGVWDWPTYGHDAQRTFHGRTLLTESTAATLTTAWFFPTGDAVTATPTVVDGTVYAGSWDGYFYAVALSTGTLLWKFKLHPQPAVSPQPGSATRDASSDGGLVTSSAWYEPAEDGRPALVLFGGGYTLYALRATTGALFWSHDYTSRPEHPADPVHDDARIFSSPVVVDGKVIVGVTPDGGHDRRGYIVAASIATGRAVWTRQTDLNAAGKVANDGCGGVWSSGTLLPRSGLVVFDVADCHFDNPAPLSESVIALRVRDGSVAWAYRPDRADDSCDLDFGATANAGLSSSGNATFLGVGSKDGTYYSLDPATGHLRWERNVVFGGFAGGFIATAAYDGSRVYGSTALGDVGRFESNGPVVCDPSNPRDTSSQNPTVHSFVVATGKVAWQANDAASFAPTTVAGGMTFNGLALQHVIQIRDASSGRLVTSLPVEVPTWSGIATVGNAIVAGTGGSAQASPDGIIAFTPGGVHPAVPGGQHR